MPTSVSLARVMLHLQEITVFVMLATTWTVTESVNPAQADARPAPMVLLMDVPPASTMQFYLLVLVLVLLVTVSIPTECVLQSHVMSLV